MKKNLLVAVVTNSRRLVVFGAVDIGTVMKGAILSSHWTTSPLILKMPMKTGERAMLLTLVLQKQRALVHAKFFEIPKIQTRLQYYVSYLCHESISLFLYEKKRRETVRVFFARIEKLFED